MKPNSKKMNQSIAKDEKTFKKMSIAKDEKIFRRMK